MNGPGSYDFGNKRQYRRTLWNRIEERLGKPRKEAVVVILDDVEAGECCFLLDRGYRAENIYAVNYGLGEPAVARAIAATINAGLRRDGRPRVNAMGCSLSVALERLKCQGIVPDAINADFCANVNLNSLDELAEIKAHLPETVILSVNMLKGRELEEWRTSRDEARDILPSDNKSAAGDFARYTMQWDALRGSYDASMYECAHHADRICLGKYRSSSGQTMLWWVGRVREHTIACRDEMSLHADMTAVAQAKRGEFRMTHAWMPLCVQMMAVDAGGDFAKFASGVAFMHDMAQSADSDVLAVVMETPKRFADCLQKRHEASSKRQSKYATKVIDQGRTPSQLYGQDEASGLRALLDMPAERFARLMCYITDHE